MVKIDASATLSTLENIAINAEIIAVSSTSDDLSYQIELDNGFCLMVEKPLIIIHPEDPS